MPYPTREQRAYGPVEAARRENNRLAAAGRLTPEEAHLLTLHEEAYQDKILRERRSLQQERSKE